MRDPARPTVKDSTFERFRFRSPESFKAKLADLGLDLPWDDDLSILATRVQVGRHVLPNSLAIHPMEGCDATLDGRPSELTWRRYERFARGGAGLLWYESTAPNLEGRDSPAGLYLGPETVDDFARLVDHVRRCAQDEFGPNHQPLHILQIAHCGRFSRDLSRKRTPFILFHDPYLDRIVEIDDSYPVLTDDDLERLEDLYVDCAVLAHRAGFDGVDIKTCHRYFLNECLAAFTRPGKYGGSFDNRTRFFFNVVGRIRDLLGPDFIITTRMNATDMIPYPYGWGMSLQNPQEYDLTEPIRFARLLRERGITLLNVSAGCPYYNPHVGRPFDQPIHGAYVPPHHPLLDVWRFLHWARQIQEAVPEMAVVGTGYSYLRQFLGPVGAGVIRQGWARIIGVGREAFSYPNFARDLLAGTWNMRQQCITCSQCTQIMRDGGTTGCVPHDSDIYLPIYLAGRAGKPKPPVWTGLHL